MFLRKPCQIFMTACTFQTLVTKLIRNLTTNQVIQGLKSWQDRKRHCFLTRTKNIDGNFNLTPTNFSTGPLA